MEEVSIILIEGICNKNNDINSDPIYQYSQFYAGPWAEILWGTLTLCFMRWTLKVYREE